MPHPNHPLILRHIFARQHLAVKLTQDFIAGGLGELFGVFVLQHPVNAISKVLGVEEL